MHHSVPRRIWTKDAVEKARDEEIAECYVRYWKRLQVAEQEKQIRSFKPRVLELAAQGLRHREIADEVGLNHHMVRRLIKDFKWEQRFGGLPAHALSALREFFDDHLITPQNMAKMSKADMANHMGLEDREAIEVWVRSHGLEIGP